MMSSQLIAGPLRLSVFSPTEACGIPEMDAQCFGRHSLQASLPATRPERCPSWK